MTKQYNLTTFDIPSINRVSLGFDRLFDDLHRNFANSVSNTYPPHNIIKRDDTNYTLEVAVAGFKEDELSVEVKDDMLTVSGTHEDETKDEQGSPTVNYQHRGISRRSFTRSVRLGDHMEVAGAALQDGILTVDIKVNIPEEEQARKIQIAYKK